jgi:hypothetical protein
VLHRSATETTLQRYFCCIQEQPLQPEEREKEDCRTAWGRHLYEMRVVLDKTEGEEEACEDAAECAPDVGWLLVG